MTDYRPIACDQHSVLEVLALRRSQVDVRAVERRADRERAAARVADREHPLALERVLRAAELGERQHHHDDQQAGHDK